MKLIITIKNVTDDIDRLWDMFRWIRSFLRIDVGIDLENVKMEVEE